MNALRNLSIAGCLLFSALLSAQVDAVSVNKISEFNYSWTYSSYTSIFDAQGDPYLYTASMELGLVTFDVSDMNNPVPVDTIMPAAMNGLKLTNISQFGNYIFGSLGGFHGITQDAGLVIFDVSVPGNAVITDVWDSTEFSEGSAIAITDGQYAYLGAMTEGVIILDVSDVNNIEYVSHLLPFTDFPEVPGPFSVPNARGLALKHPDTLMVCNDAGGLRMLDVTDKFNPVEIGMYANADIESMAQSAYNNIEIVGNYAYIPVDYCGLIVVDITDENMTDVNWINTWGCDTTSWDGAPGHTNQVVSVGDSLLFVSGADTEMLVYDITDKTNPVQVGQFGGFLDNRVAWGIDVRDGYIATAMVNNPAGFPYDSNWGGICLYEWKEEFAAIDENQNSSAFTIYPNPATGTIKINNANPGDPVSIHSIDGQVVFKGYYSNEGIGVSKFSPGVYVVKINSASLEVTTRFVVY